MPIAERAAISGAAQARGEVRGQGEHGQGKVPNENLSSTLNDIGLDRKQVHEARQVRDELRALAARLDAIERRLDAVERQRQEPAARPRAAVDPSTLIG